MTLYISKRPPFPFWDHPLLPFGGWVVLRTPKPAMIISTTLDRFTTGLKKGLLFGVLSTCFHYLDIQEIHRFSEGSRMQQVIVLNAFRQLRALDVRSSNMVLVVYYELSQF